MYEFSHALDPEQTLAKCPRCVATFAATASVNCGILSCLAGLAAAWKMYTHPASTKSAVGKLTGRWGGSVGLAAAVGSTYFLVAYLSLSGMFFLASEGDGVMGSIVDLRGS